MRHGGSLTGEPQYSVTRLQGPLRSILVDVVADPNKIRFGGIGDWHDPSNGNRLVIVAELPNADMTLALAIHEIVEQAMCMSDGVRSVDVDEWDKNYTGEGEPGEADGCPYFDQHAAAIAVEKCVCETLGVDWNEYSEALGKVFNGSNTVSR